MTCRDFVEFLWEYLCGDLSERQRFEFDAHVAICPHCVAYLRTYRRTVELGREVFDDLEAEVPAEVPEELVQAILAARSESV